MGVLNSIIVPVNPDYSWELDPAEQVEYVNPVTLNNHTLRLANAAINIAQRTVRVNERIAALQTTLAEAKNAIADLEQDLLSRYPAPVGATKTLKQLAAYVRQMAFTDGVKEKYRELADTLRKAEIALVKEEIDADSLKQVWRTIELVGEHIQTHLSYVKHDKDHA